MKIFVSWSGPRSKAAAKLLREWIKDVLPLAGPWMSEEDIPSGTIWFDGINQELEQTRYGILCVTQQNQTAPWLLWEAGALFGGTNDGRRREVVPLLVDLGKNDLIAPLNKYQAVTASNSKDMKKMLAAINSESERPLERDRFVRQFERCWGEWHGQLTDAIAAVADVRVGGGSSHTFGEASERFRREKKIRRYDYGLGRVAPYIDQLPVDQIDDNHLERYKEDRLAGKLNVPDGQTPPPPAEAATLHKEIQLVKQVLKSAKSWGWLKYVPDITQVGRRVARDAYVLTWDEQERFLGGMRDNLRQLSLFSLNTGAQKGLLRDLEWSWLTSLPGLDIFAFVVPETYGVKNRGRVILLNSVARRVIRAQKEVGHDRYVFPGRGGGKWNIGKTFQAAWKRANLSTKGNHAMGPSNLRHTFEDRLKKAGVTLEDREFLLWRGSAVRERADRYPDYRHLLDCLERIATPLPREELSL